MPLVDGGPGSDVFWNTTDILNFARILVNDAQSSLAGQDLADDKPYTWPLLNLCYAKLANWLEDNNVESASYNEATISLPASAVYSDPNAQSRLGYDGFTDAAGFTYDTPTLPTDLLEPRQLWQTPTGQNVPDREMRQVLGGLEGPYYNGINGGIYGGMYGSWEFRQNSIYFLGGAYQPTDIRIRYIPSFTVLVQPAAGEPAPTIWFARAGEALAYLVAAEFAEIRNAKNAVNLRAKANEQLQIIANKSAKRANQAQTRRRGYGFNRGRRLWL
jgi:hypothetical protein